MENILKALFNPALVEKKENLYCCFREGEQIYFAYNTLALSRRESVSLLSRDMSWSKWKDKGWKCGKIKALFLLNNKS